MASPARSLGAPPPERLTGRGQSRGHACRARPGECVAAEREPRPCGKGGAEQMRPGERAGSGTPARPEEPRPPCCCPRLGRSPEFFSAAVASGGTSRLKEDQIKLSENGFFFFFFFEKRGVQSPPCFLFTLNRCWIVLAWPSKSLFSLPLDSWE